MGLFTLVICMYAGAKLLKRHQRAERQRLAITNGTGGETVTAEQERVILAWILGIPQIVPSSSPQRVILERILGIPQIVPSFSPQRVILARILGIPQIVPSFSPPGTFVDRVVIVVNCLRFTYSLLFSAGMRKALEFPLKFVKAAKVPAKSVLYEQYVDDDSKQHTGPLVLPELRELWQLVSIYSDLSYRLPPKRHRRNDVLDLAHTRQERMDDGPDRAPTVLMSQRKARTLIPAYTLVLHHKQKCLLLLIRGTDSFKDWLTNLSATPVEWSVTLPDEEGNPRRIEGLVHSGIRVAAKCIFDKVIGYLSNSEYSSYVVKVVGHSLGGATGALVTYMLRQKRGFRTAQCFCISPAACMTWDLAEFCSFFVKTYIYGTDVIPAASDNSFMDFIKGQTEKKTQIHLRYHNYLLPPGTTKHIIRRGGITMWLTDRTSYSKLSLSRSMMKDHKFETFSDQLEDLYRAECERQQSDDLNDPTRELIVLAREINDGIHIIEEDDFSMPEETVGNHRCEREGEIRPIRF